MYLAINDTLVQMDKAVRDMDNLQASKYFWLGLVGSREGKPVVMMPYWSTISKTSILGDPTVATKEKGEAMLAAAVDGLVEFIEIFKQKQIEPRVNHHE